MSNIVLKSGSTSAVIQRAGAQMVSFKGANGREVIWQADPAVWGDSSPILFPICGTAKDDMIKIGGQTFQITKHGFARTPVYEVAKRGDDFVELILTANDETRAQYPFEFVFHVIFTLRENGFRTDYIIENKSDRVMPFCVGGHPGFNVPMDEGDAFTDYRLVFPEREDGKNLLVPGGGMIDGYDYIPLENGTTLPLNHTLFDERDTLLFSEFKSRNVKLVHKDSGHGIRLSYPKMEVLAVWTMPENHADYVCLEPWHGLPALVDESGNFEDKPFVTLLSPGMSYQCGYDVELI